MLIETPAVRSKSELLKEFQAVPVIRAVIYRNVDKKAWEQVAKEFQSAASVVVNR